MTGFNKRLLKMENIKTIYESSGYIGVYDYITKPDSLFYGDCKEIVEIIMLNSCDTIKRLKLEKVLYA